MNPIDPNAERLEAGTAEDGFRELHHAVARESGLLQSKAMIASLHEEPVEETLTRHRGSARHRCFG